MLSDARRCAGQRGIVAVEMGMILGIFVTLLMAVSGLAHFMWTLNAASDATRFGARLASVCDLGEPYVKTRMRQRLPALGNEHILIDYIPSGCVADDAVNACRMVRVSISGYDYPLSMGLASLSVPLPPFQTLVPREVMRSAGNPVCRSR